MRGRKIRRRHCFEALHYPTGTESRYRGNVPRIETRGALFHRRAAPCHLGVDSAVCNVGAGSLNPGPEWLSGTAQSNGIFDKRVREFVPNAAMETD